MSLAKDQSGFPAKRDAMGEADRELVGEDILTIADLNQEISDTIESISTLQNVRCLGEISEITEYDWGVFIDLVYDGCELTALMWASRYQDLDTDLEPGTEVVLTGNIDFYPEDGTLSLKPWNATVLGEGDRARRVQQLRSELEERGWFDDSHKQALPRFPRRIGVVTSLDGDARYDIEESIHSRYPSVDLVICGARVQGDHAPESIASSVRTLDRTYDVDVIVLGRGGGSETDLAAFDTEPVAEAVFTAQTPIVVAVGHRDDEPLVGEVADATAITPTEAGTTVVEDREEIEEMVRELEVEVEQAFDRLVTAQLDEFTSRIDDAYATTVRAQVTDLEQRVEQAYVAHEQRAEQARQLQRYKYAIAALVLLLFGLGLLFVVILL